MDPSFAEQCQLSVMFKPKRPATQSMRMLFAMVFDCHTAFPLATVSPLVESVLR